MNKIWKYLIDEILYIYIWRKEIAKEKRYERKNQQKEYLKNWYKQQTGMNLNLDIPKTFTEKQQWLKLYGVTKEKILCTDKYMVREYVAKTIGEQYLIPIIRNGEKECFNNPYDIEYEDLPNAFVIQCNHGSHMTHIVKDKKNFSLKSYKKLQKRISKELKIEYAYCHGYEMQYKGIEPCVFLTKYMNENGDLPDYKLFYFHGEFLFMFVDQSRFGNHKRTVYDKNLNIAEFQFDAYDPIEFSVDKEKVCEMVNLANNLSKKFDHVRVDFYLCDRRIFFGEMTFSSASGRKIMKPVSSDLMIGEYLKIDGEKI